MPMPTLRLISSLKSLAGVVLAMALSMPAMAQVSDLTTQYRNGDAAFRLGHMNAAFGIFTARCKEGSGYDCFRAGDMYRRAMGTEQDYVAAGEAYAAGCDLDYADACLALANMHFTGQGLAEDFPKARALYEDGCDLNDAVSCAVLGNMMYSGMGGGRDRIMGADLMRRSCLQEVEYACSQVRRYGLSNKGERSNTLRRGWWNGN
ncbi:MAG: tetratricopeptide repeat protein [Pseudomonadota bacterium]